MIPPSTNYLRRMQSLMLSSLLVPPSLSAVHTWADGGKVLKENIMEDSMIMTIEFLRARLLSERSVSRAARQRADQQTKKVMELEEKLRFISVQRKKAEQAAAEVLSILEIQGIRDLSEEIDSSSEEEDVPCDKELEYESSTASRLERSRVEIELSGSEPETSNSQGKSLSWKSHSKSPDFGKNQISKEFRQRQRQRSIFSTSQSCPKQRFGKSCRKIKARDIGLEDDSEKYTCGVEYSSNCNGGHDEYRDDHNEQSGGDKVMERVLDHQAELIGQFQAEEIAQRDWEDKFNKIVPSVDHEPIKTSSLTATTDSFEEFKLAEDYYKSAEEMSSTETSGCEALSTPKKNTSDIAFSNNLAYKDPINSLENDKLGTTIKESEDIHGMIRNELPNEAVHRDEYASQSKPHPSTIPLGKNQTETSNKLGDVLEALQFAKLSLSQELNKLPSPHENTTISTAAPNIDIPVDTASLFRLPTDTFPDELLSMPKFSDRELNFTY